MLRPRLDRVHDNCPTSQTFVSQICAKMTERERQGEKERESCCGSNRTSGQVSRNVRPVCWESKRCTLWETSHSCCRSKIQTDHFLSSLTMFSHLPPFQIYYLGKDEPSIVCINKTHKIIKGMWGGEGGISTNDEKSKRWSRSEAGFIRNEKTHKNGQQLCLLLLAARPLFVL